LSAATPIVAAIAAALIYPIAIAIRMMSLLWKKLLADPGCNRGAASIGENRPFFAIAG
jgi:hypothetical protein